MSLQEPQNPFPRSVRPYAQVGAFANLNIGRIGGDPGDRLFLTALAIPYFECRVYRYAGSTDLYKSNTTLVVFPRLYYGILDSLPVVR